jgi:hypothetical protein
MDVWSHQIRMAEVMQQSAGDLQQAIQDARSMAEEYVLSGWTSRENLLFWPTAVTHGWQIAMKELARQTMRQIATWEDVLRQQPILSWLATRQEITRVWGPIGLFWALLLEQLESKRPYRLCKWCHRALQGKKTQCHPEDDLSCYTEWRRKARAEQRARKSRAVDFKRS